MPEPGEVDRLERADHALDVCWLRFWQIPDLTSEEKRIFHDGFQQASAVVKLRVINRDREAKGLNSIK